MNKLLLATLFTLASTVSLAQDIKIEPDTGCRLIPVVGERTGNILYYVYENPGCAPVIKDSKETVDAPREDVAVVDKEIFDDIPQENDKKVVYTESTFE